MKATVLIQTTTPADAPRLVEDLSAYGTATHVAGAYDVILELDSGPDETGRTVLEIQTLDGIERTLTLPHVDPEEQTR